LTGLHFGELWAIFIQTQKNLGMHTFVFGDFGLMNNVFELLLLFRRQTYAILGWHCEHLIQDQERIPESGFLVLLQDKKIVLEH